MLIMCNQNIFRTNGKSYRSGKGKETKTDQVDIIY
jgi:hypothetical protein